MTEADTVVIVAARKAWPLYLEGSGYLCQPGRSFRDVQYMGFYAQRTIYPKVAKILHTRQDVDRSDACAARLQLSPDALDRRLGRLLRVAGRQLWQSGNHMAFVLSDPEANETITLNGGAGIHHAGASAWTMGQRYTTLSALRFATTTDDLPGGAR